MLRPRRGSRRASRAAGWCGPHRTIATRGHSAPRPPPPATRRRGRSPPPARPAGPGAPAHPRRQQGGGADRPRRRLGPQRSGAGHVAQGAGGVARVFAQGRPESDSLRRRGGASCGPASCRRGGMIAIALALLAAGRVVTLDEAVQAARERQPQLRQARANTEAAGARAQQSLAPLLPQVTAIAGYQRTTANGINRPGSGSASAGNGSSWDTVNSFTDSVQASQLIFDFGAGTNRWRSAKALADAQAANERAVVLQVDYNVRAAYFDTRANQALVQVARENLQNQERHLAQT